MADYRQIHVHIWKDAWFLDLSSAEKLLFIYLFSNERASVSGLYELSPKVIAFETDLSKQDVATFMGNFVKAGKIAYDGNVVWIKKLRQYNATNSIKVKTRIDKDVAIISDCIIKRAYCDAWQIPYPESQIPYPENESEQEQEQEQETEQEIGADAPPHPAQEFLDYWMERFPNKPRTALSSTIKRKWKTRTKSKDFRENWRKAVDHASRSVVCQEQEAGWCSPKWFLSNEEKWQDILTGKYDWKNGQRGASVAAAPAVVEPIPESAYMSPDDFFKAGD